MWTIRRVVGDVAYTSDVHNAWVRVYSRMLSLIVPQAVKFELETLGVRQEERIKDEKASLSLRLDLLSSCASPSVLSPSVASTCLSGGSTSMRFQPDRNVF